MNNDQLTVKTNLDPLLAICGFLKDALDKKVAHVSNSVAFAMTPDMQRNKLISLKQTLDEVDAVKQKLDNAHNQLMRGDVLVQSSLDAEYPGFKAEMQLLRNKLVEAFQDNL